MQEHIISFGTDRWMAGQQRAYLDWTGHFFEFRSLSDFAALLSAETRADYTRAARAWRKRLPQFPPLPLGIALAVLTREISQPAAPNWWLNPGRWRNLGALGLILFPRRFRLAITVRVDPTVRNGYEAWRLLVECCSLEHQEDGDNEAAYHVWDRQDARIARLALFQHSEAFSLYLINKYRDVSAATALLGRAETALIKSGHKGGDLVVARRQSLLLVRVRLTYEGISDDACAALLGDAAQSLCPTPTGSSTSVYQQWLAFCLAANNSSNDLASQSFSAMKTFCGPESDPDSLGINKFRRRLELVSKSLRMCRSCLCRGGHHVRSGHWGFRDVFDGCRSPILRDTYRFEAPSTSPGCLSSQLPDSNRAPGVSLRLAAESKNAALRSGRAHRRWQAGWHFCCRRFGPQTRRVRFADEGPYGRPARRVTLASLHRGRDPVRAAGSHVVAMGREASSGTLVRSRRCVHFSVLRFNLRHRFPCLVNKPGSQGSLVAVLCCIAGICWAFLGWQRG
jgi:hypothetical protein